MARSSYTLVEITNTEDNFNSFSFDDTLNAPSINNNGLVVWSASLDNGGLGIFSRSSTGSLQTIASTDLGFSKFGFPSINDSGKVVFQAKTGDQSGIYLGYPFARPTVVASTGQAIALTDGKGHKKVEKFTSFGEDPAINNRGRVAFKAQLTLTGDSNSVTGSNSGIFVGNDRGKIEPIADTVGKFNGLKFADLWGTPFEGSTTPSINKKGVTVFWGLLDQKLPEGSPEYSQIPSPLYSGNVRGIFVSDLSGKIKTVADNTGKYLSFSGTPDINNKGDILYIFRGDNLNDFGTPYRGINLYENAQTTTLVDNNNPYQGVVDKFYRFADADISDSNRIAFRATFDPLGTQSDPLTGIFTGQIIAGQLDNLNKVVAIGDTLPFGDTRKTVLDLAFFNNEGLNNKGQITFTAEFTDGTQGIYLADPSYSLLTPFPEVFSLAGSASNYSEV
ncbi:hypothetical protein NIES22_28750 [Calothrix brevissima NIES-22]|nr:hypothetical protein NIES22_28750 [Calothrix brevissima NIES-22]